MYTHVTAHGYSSSYQDSGESYFVPKANVADGEAFIRNVMEKVVAATGAEAVKHEDRRYQYDYNSSGSTVSMLYLDPETGKGAAANLGDAPVYEVQLDRKSGEVAVKELVHPHSILDEKGELTEEGKRFSSDEYRVDTYKNDYYAGGFCDRTLGRLEPPCPPSLYTRGLGLEDYEKHISHEPDIHPVDLNLDAENKRSFVVVSSDGLDRIVGGADKLQEFFKGILDENPEATTEELQQGLAGKVKKARADWISKSIKNEDIAAIVRETFLENEEATRDEYEEKIGLKFSEKSHLWEIVPGGAVARQGIDDYEVVSKIGHAINRIQTPDDVSVQVVDVDKLAKDKVMKDMNLLMAVFDGSGQVGDEVARRGQLAVSAAVTSQFQSGGIQTPTEDVKPIDIKQPPTKPRTPGE